MTALKKFILSFLFTIALTCITVLVTGDATMWLFLIMEGVHFAFLGLPLLFGALRYGGFMLSRNTFYVFVCAANIWLGLLSIALWCSHRFTADLPITFAPNLLAGILVFADIFFPRRNSHAL